MKRMANYLSLNAIRATLVHTTPKMDSNFKSLAASVKDWNSNNFSNLTNFVNNLSTSSPGSIPSTQCVFASNLAIWLSNNMSNVMINNTNTLAKVSQSSIYASNVATWMSNQHSNTLVASNHIHKLQLTSSFTSNLAMWLSNTMVPNLEDIVPTVTWTSNTIIQYNAFTSNALAQLDQSCSYASNVATWMSNQHSNTSNYIHELQRTSSFTSNLAMWLSNTVVPNIDILVEDIVPTVMWTSNAIADRVPNSVFETFNTSVLDAFTTSSVIQGALIQGADWASNAITTLNIKYESLSNLLSNVVGVLNIQLP
jgi:hypothetical protein